MNSDLSKPVTVSGVDERSRKILFWGCFIVLVASAFGFVFRSFLMPQWGIQFDLSKTQQGEIFGVSFWPFGISIVVFSLIIDKIGYKKSMIFAFLCHSVSVLLTIMADGYWMLYVGTFLFALGNGAAEAVVNPVVATMYPREKTKWLNILHAGWPVGIAIAGVMGIAMLHYSFSWEVIIGVIMLPTIVYGLLIAKRHFPVNERVKAGVTYLEMLKEVGILGILIIVGLCTFQLGSLFGWSYMASTVITILIVAFFGFFVRSLGRPLFIILLLLMIPLATTELGTDSWITDLMTPEMQKIGLQGGWVLVCTSIIMAVLRFYAGPIVERFSPSLYASLGIFLPLITTNCAVLGVAILVVSKEFTFGGEAHMLNLAGSVVYAIASALGFGLAMTLFAGLREQLDLNEVPKAMKGVPIALITAGILAMAFMGFSGLV